MYAYIAYACIHTNKSASICHVSERLILVLQHFQQNTDFELYCPVSIRDVQNLGKSITATEQTKIKVLKTQHYEAPRSYAIQNKLKRKYLDSVDGSKGRNY